MNKRLVFIFFGVLFVALIGSIVALAAVLATTSDVSPAPSSGKSMPSHAGGGGMGSGGSGGSGNGGSGQGSSGGGMGQGSGNGGKGQGAGGSRSGGGQSGGGGAGGAGGGKCSKNQSQCNGTCVDLQTSSDNCGSCGNSCGQTQTCNAGKCMCAVPMDVKNPGFESGSLSPWVFTTSPSARARPSVAKGSAAASGSHYLKVQSNSPSGSMPIEFTIDQETEACPGTFYDFSFAAASSCATTGCGECTLIACFGPAQSCETYPAPTKFTTFSASYYTVYHTNRSVNVGTYGTCDRTSVSLDSIEVTEVKQQLLDTDEIRNK